MFGGKKTIDKAIAGLTRIIRDLEAIEQETHVEFEQLSRQREEIDLRQSAVSATKRHAASIRMKLSDLLAE